MATFDIWTHQFCLACDKQVQVDAPYCSEACRLSDHEKTSSTSSQPNSPGFAPPSYSPWSPHSNTKPSSTKFYLSPAYDFTDAQPYGATTHTSTSSNRYLSPSSSHTSLCSMHSNCSTGDADHLSDKARRELKAYAVSFEQVRLQRRRSY